MYQVILNTNLVKPNIDRDQEDSLCRSCRKEEEYIDHFISGRSILVQKEYKRRQNDLGKTVYWKLVKKCNIEVKVSGMRTSQKVFQRIF